MLGEIQHLEQLVHFTRGNWDLALCRSPQTCFSCLNYVVHSIYVQSSTCSSHAGNFRINMFEPVSALLSIWSWHLWFSVTWAHHLSIPLQTPFILLLIHSTCYLVLYPIPLHVTHSHYLRPGPHNCFIGHYGIFTMFSPSSVSPSWLCNKQIRQVLGSDCLYLNPDLGPLFCITGSHNTFFMIL